MRKLILTTSLLLLTIPAQAGTNLNNSNSFTEHVQKVGYSEDSRKGLATSDQIRKKLNTEKTDSQFFVSPFIDLSIRFKSGSAELSEESYTQVFELAEALNHPELLYMPFVIEGHTDSVGSDALNQSLSERRANTLKRVLHEKYGVNTNKITTAGYGESKPVADNATDEGRAKNRRVTIVRVK